MGTSADDAMQQISELATEEALQDCLTESIFTLLRTFSSKASLSTWNFIMHVLSLSSVLSRCRGNY
jgi:hypothetical protein